MIDGSIPLTQPKLVPTKKTNAELLEEMEAEWGVEEIVDGEPRFKHFDKQIVFKVLKGLGTRTGVDGKPVEVPASHLNYSLLTESQKMKSFKLWKAILGEPEGRTLIFAAVKNVINTQEAESLAKESERSKNVTGSEWYRLALLMDYEGAKLAWTETRRPLDRQHLDAKHGGDTEVSNAADPWKRLAEMFNDPASPFRNLACKYDQDGAMTKEMAPPCLSDGGTQMLPFDDIFRRVNNLDPSKFVNRDGGWIKEKTHAVRTWLSKNYAPGYGFMLSGKQDAENFLSAWTQYCQGGGHPTYTDALVLTPSGSYVQYSLSLGTYTYLMILCIVLTSIRLIAIH